MSQGRFYVTLPNPSTGTLDNVFLTLRQARKCTIEVVGVHNYKLTHTNKAAEWVSTVCNLWWCQFKAQILEISVNNSVNGVICCWCWNIVKLIAIKMILKNDNHFASKSKKFEKSLAVLEKINILLTYFHVMDFLITSYIRIAHCCKSL